MWSSAGPQSLLRDTSRSPREVTGPTHGNMEFLLLRSSSVRSDTGTGLSPWFWAFSSDPRDPRSWCSTEKAQQKQQDTEHSPHVSLTGHLLPLCCLLLDGTWLVEVLRAGKGLVLVTSGRMERKRLCEPSWRGLGRNLALPIPTPSSFSLGKIQPRSHGVSSTLQPCPQ